MKRTLALSGAIVFAAASAAQAAGPGPAPSEPVVVAPAPVAATGGDWEGGYVGGQLGYGFGEFDLDLGAVDEFDTDGIVGGFHAGYLWDFGTFVVGPELQYDFSDLSIDDGTNSGSFDGIARLKARFGYDMGPGLLYGSAGVAYTNFDGISGVNDIDYDDPGYVVGFGYDYQLNDRWIVGGEYQYHRFNDFGADGNDVTFGTVHLRASYRF